MLVVFRQSDNEAFGRHTQAAAAANLHIWTFQMGSHCPRALQHYDVEAVAMAVTDQNVARVTRVNSVRICCQRLIAETTDKFPILHKHGYTVALKNTRPMTRHGWQIH